MLVSKGRRRARLQRRSTSEQGQECPPALQAAARALTTAHAARMSLELFTGGNIRLEEGRPPPSSLLAAAVAAASTRAGAAAGGGPATTPLSGAASALAGVSSSSLTGDVWYSTCADLVRSRFSAADFAPLHVTGVRVLRAIRVHNRYLRSRFEKRITHVLGLQVRGRGGGRSQGCCWGSKPT